jgi:hypothetical protein
MYQTKAAQSLKNLFARYHEPLQLSERESRKFLDGLKASFRGHLDRAYGVSPSSSSFPNAQAEAAQGKAQRQSAANQHLKTLLSNPLFSYQNPTIPPAPQSVSARDPMDVFDHAVSRGLMNLRAATGILMAKKKHLQKDLDALAAGTSSGTAKRVVQWLRSSRSEYDLDFLDDQPFMKELMPFLVAEGFEDTAWEWIARLLSPAHGDPSIGNQRHRASSLLKDLVRLKSQPQNKDLDAAIMTLVQARENFSSSPLLPHLLLGPWRSLSWLSTVESFTRNTPSIGVFNAHMATAERLNSPVEVERAHLRLYHPTQPDASPALRLFKDDKILKRLVKRLPNKTTETSKSKRSSKVPWLFALGNDTVNYLSRSGRGEEAREVGVIVQSELDHYALQGA